MSDTTMGLDDLKIGAQKLLARSWGWVLLRGVLGIIVGLIALFAPLPALKGLILVFVVYSLADGIGAIVSAIRAARADKSWGWLLFEGVIDIGAGIAAFFLPGVAVLTFVVIIAVWALITGITSVIAAFRLDAEHGRWWLGLAGVLSVVFGVLLLVQPFAGAKVLTMWFGAYTLAFGVLLSVLAFRLRSLAKRT